MSFVRPFFEIHHLLPFTNLCERAVMISILEENVDKLNNLAKSSVSPRKTTSRLNEIVKINNIEYQ